MRAIWAIIPVKQLTHAKQRLGGLLNGEERRALGLAMLEDVLSALNQSRGLAGIMLVSSDPQACDLGRHYGARILPDSAQGLNAAVSAAARLLAGEGVNGALVLHGDIPLARAEEIERLIAACEATPAIAIAPDAARDGSNAMLAAPPDLIAFRYGRASFAAHLDEAAQCGVTPQVLDLPGLAFDVDEPDDLFTLTEMPGNSRAQHYLRALRLGDRSPAIAAQTR